mgnify:CR=1 FL=1
MQPFPSVAVTVIGNVPVWVVVPLSTPAVESVNPLGSVLAVENVTVPNPSVCVNVSPNGRPIVPVAFVGFVTVIVWHPLGVVSVEVFGRFGSVPFAPSSAIVAVFEIWVTPLRPVTCTGVGRFVGYFPTTQTQQPRWWDVAVNAILDQQGKPEEVLAVSPSTLRAAHRRRMVPDGSLLVLVGDLSPARTLDRVEAALGDWSADGSATQVPKVPAMEPGPLLLVDRPGAVQSNLRVGGPAPSRTDPAYAAAELANALFGGYFSSRLVRNIREDKGYTYSPFSQISSRYRDAYWAQNADVTTKDTGASLKEIFAEIDRLQAEPPSAEELKGIQNYVAGSFVLQNSSRAGIIGPLAFLDLHGLPATSLTEFVQKVHAVTPAKVQELAQKHIADDKAIIVLVGDRKVIEAQVKAFGEIK